MGKIIILNKDVNLEIGKMTEKYFFLKHATDLKQIGKYPQCVILDDDINYLIYSKSKLTDFLSGSFWGCSLLISNKFEELIKFQTSAYYKAYKTIIYKDKQKTKIQCEDYSLFKVKDDFIFLECIDYSKMNPYIVEYVYEKYQKHISINSKDEYDLIKKEIDPKGIMEYKILADEVYLLPEFDYDIFPAYHFFKTGGVVISERLKIAIEKENITGIEIKPCEMLKKNKI